MYLLELTQIQKKEVRKILKKIKKHPSLSKLVKDVSFKKDDYNSSIRILVDIALCYQDKLAYTKWNILGRATIALDSIVFIKKECLKYILLHELLHVKQGYWKSWLLILPHLRRKIEDSINREVEKTLDLFFKI